MEKWYVNCKFQVNVSSNGYSSGLWMKQIRFKPSLWFVHCVFRQNMLLSKCIPPLRSGFQWNSCFFKHKYTVLYLNWKVPSALHFPFIPLSTSRPVQDFPHKVVMTLTLILSWFWPSLLTFGFLLQMIINLKS